MSIPPSSKEQILNILKNSADRISGEEISRLIGTSRVAVWKQIKQLTELGYQIDSSSRGYRLRENSDYYTPLEFPDMGGRVTFYESLESTMNEGWKILNSDRPDKTMIIAEKQETGKGRGGGWRSETGGLYLTYLRKADMDIRYAPLLKLAGSLAVLELLKKYCDLEGELRGLCDVFIRGAKLAGCLSQLKAENDRITAYGLGIGIYVNQKDLPRGMTSLFRITGKQHSRSQLVKILEGELESLTDRFQNGTPRGFLLKEWSRHAAWRGKPIEGRDLYGQSHRGRLEKLTPDGLFIVSEKGRREYLRPETCHPTEPKAPFSC